MSETMTRDDLIRSLAERAMRREPGGERLYLPGWDAGAWRTLLAGAHLVELGNGDQLLQRADAGSDLFFLAEGRLEVSVPQAGSVSLSPLVRIEAGSVVGEISFLDGEGRSASVWSRGRSVLFRLPRAAFDGFRAERPDLACDLALAIARTLALRLRQSTGGPAKGPRTLAY